MIDSHSGKVRVSSAFKSSWKWFQDKEFGARKVGEKVPGYIRHNHGWRRSEGPGNGQPTSPPSNQPGLRLFFPPNPGRAFPCGFPESGWWLGILRDFKQRY